MLRLLFVKEGVAIWSSHLDLMRALMRSFRRAGIDLKHSQGFTPHPELSILMPLSVGVESQCEIAEFTLAEGCAIPAAEIAPRMNPVLPAGLRALDSYEGGQKAGKLAWLRARLELSYSPVGAASGRPPEAEADGMQNAKCKMQNEGSGIRHQASGDGGERILRCAQNDGRGVGVDSSTPLRSAAKQVLQGAQNDGVVGSDAHIAPAASEGCAEASGDASLRRLEDLRALFALPSLIVEKHSKKGDVEMDIAPMIREIHVGAASGRQPEAEADGMQNAKCKMQNEGSGIRHQASGDEGTDSSTPLRSAQNDGQGTLVLEAVVAAQNPTLNPLLLVTAIEKYLPEHRPEHVLCRRLEIYDADMNVFR